MDFICSCYADLSLMIFYPEPSSLIKFFVGDGVLVLMISMLLLMV